MTDLPASNGDCEFCKASSRSVKAKPMFIPSPALCHKCVTPTRLARITPGLSGFAIRTFKCPLCDEVQQIVADLADPLKSTRANGWLQGQLQAPT